MRSAALELDGDVAAHRRGRHHQRLDGKARSRVRGSRRGTARDGDQPRQQQGDQGASHKSARQSVHNRHLLAQLSSQCRIGCGLSIWIYEPDARKVRLLHTCRGTSAAGDRAGYQICRPRTVPRYDRRRRCAGSSFFGHDCGYTTPGWTSTRCKSSPNSICRSNAVAASARHWSSCPGSMPGT